MHKGPKTHKVHKIRKMHKIGMVCRGPYEILRGSYEDKNRKLLFLKGL